MDKLWLLSTSLFQEGWAYHLPSRIPASPAVRAMRQLSVENNDFIFMCQYLWVEMSTWMLQGSPCQSVAFSSFSLLTVAFSYSCMSTHLANTEPLSQGHLRLVLWAWTHGAFVNPSTHKILFLKISYLISIIYSFMINVLPRALFLLPERCFADICIFSGRHTMYPFLARHINNVIRGCFEHWTQ